MDFNYDSLCEDIGLKFNERIILGKDQVFAFIEENSAYFLNSTLKPLDGSNMLYGYNYQNQPIKIGFQNDLIQRIVITTEKINYKRYKAVIAFDGHEYSGFQIQKDQKTIQGVITEIVSGINKTETLIQGCSRTDAGVHALNYVFHFDSGVDIEETKWKELLNNHLPKDIQIKSVKLTHPLFHSRYDVSGKIYKYILNQGSYNPLSINYEWNIDKIDSKLLEENLKQIEGKHDFSSFYKGKTNNPIREIFRTEVIKSDDKLELIFEGSGFLRYMIRIIVFSLVEISSKKTNISMLELLEMKSRKNTKHLAPAGGLYLDKIIY